MADPMSASAYTTDWPPWLGQMISLLGPGAQGFVPKWALLVHEGGDSDSQVEPPGGK